MPRLLKDWISSYVAYASYTEAPRLNHFWSGVSALAGALRRKVWIDHVYFQWTPCFYIVIVAKPGIVAKSTTADIAMDLLKKVPGINFGPDIATWQSLLPAFTAAAEAFEYNGDWHPMSAITLVSSELGNLLDLRNHDMVNLMITLWDGKKKLDKITKMSGNDTVEAPWINLIGCTTPSWVAENMNNLTVEGGFTSRCVFVYADKKEKLNFWPKLSVPKDILEVQKALVHDLEYIALNLVGEYEPTEEALSWMEKWYEETWTCRPAHLRSDRADGYIARRQTHLCKLAMVIAASQRDQLVLTLDDFKLADAMLVSTEHTFLQTFSMIGKTEEVLQMEKLIEALKRTGKMRYDDAYRIVYAAFPDAKAFEGMLSGAIKAGYIEFTMSEAGAFLRAL